MITKEINLTNPGSKSSPVLIMKEVNLPSSLVQSNRIADKMNRKVSVLLTFQNRRNIRYNISIPSQNRGLTIEKLNLYKLSKFDRITALSASKSIFISDKCVTSGYRFLP